MEEHPGCCADILQPRGAGAANSAQLGHGSWMSVPGQHTLGGPPRILQ